MNFTALDVDVVDDHFFLADQLVQVEAEGSHVFREFLARFLERQENARFVEFAGAAHQKLDGEKSFAATGAATDQGRAPLRQSASRDLIKAGDSRGCFPE